MPNWCENYIQITGEGINEIRHIIENLSDYDGIMHALCPIENADNEKRSLEYGTKWDFSKKDLISYDFDEDSIFIHVETAWGPPLGFIELLSIKYPFLIKIEYYEPLMDFGGILQICCNEELHSFEGTYLESMYKIDSDKFWHELNCGYVFEQCRYDAEELRKLLSFLPEGSLKLVKSMMQKQTQNA